MFTVQKNEEPGRQVYKRLLPSPDLLEYVRSYEYCESLAGNERPQPFVVSVFPTLTFFLRARCAAFEYSQERVRVLPPVIAVGPCDHRVADIMFFGHLMNLTVLFQPTGFFRLFRISPWEIRNHAFEGGDVLGAHISSLQSRLCALSRPEQMVKSVEEVLRSWCANALSRSEIHPATETLLRFNGRTNLFAIASSLGLSDSSWRRHFTTQVGVTPKRYLRMLRFMHAVASKLERPARQWTQVCLESGYYDQAHFIADCQAIALSAPSDLVRELTQMPAAMTHALYSQVPKPGERRHEETWMGELGDGLLRDCRSREEAIYEGAD